MAKWKNGILDIRPKNLCAIIRSLISEGRQPMEINMRTKVRDYNYSHTAISTRKITQNLNELQNQIVLREKRTFSNVEHQHENCSVHYS